jgi:hypothetical protein
MQAAAAEFDDEQAVQASVRPSMLRANGLAATG